VTQKGGAMPQLLQEHSDFLPPVPVTDAGGWFAIQTKPRHEKRVALELEEKDVQVFLPLYTTLRQWSDRRQQVQLPLFPSYVFDEEIETIQKVLAERVSFTNYPFLNVGQKVRIRGGSLDGVHGILTAVSNDRTLVVSIECIQRSLAIRIDGYGVDPV